MTTEAIASFGTGSMPGDRDWILNCYDWGIQYAHWILGAPPDGCDLQIVWQPHDYGDYPSIGVSWGPQRPDEYISKCQRLGGLGATPRASGRMAGEDVRPTPS